MTAPARFTQADLTRAFRAAETVGVRVRIEIEPSGKIVIMSESAQPAQTPDHAWTDDDV